MNISDLFKGEHAMIDEKQLVPLSLVPEDNLNKIGLSEERIEAVSNELDIEIEELFFDPNGGVSPFCYWDGFFYFRFMSLQEDYTQMSLGMNESFTVAKQFTLMRDKFDDFRDDEKWEEIFSYSDKKVSLLVFEGLRKEIPMNKQKEIFLNEYRRNEYGFDRLNPEMVREVLSLPTPEEYDIKQYKRNADKDGYFIVYRGVTEQSSPLDKAYSWTLDKATARFFAERFDSNGDILKAVVHKDNIRAFLSGRGESEVLVFPEDITLVN